MCLLPPPQTFVVLKMLDHYQTIWGYPQDIFRNTTCSLNLCVIAYCGDPDYTFFEHLLVPLT